MLLKTHANAEIENEKQNTINLTFQGEK